MKKPSEIFEGENQRRLINQQIDNMVKTPRPIFQVEPPTEGWEAKWTEFIQVQEAALKSHGFAYNKHLHEDSVKAFIKSLLSQSKEEAKTEPVTKINQLQNFEPTDEELEESAWFKAKKLMIEEEVKKELWDKREALAELEHDQWIAWSKNIAETEQITPARRARWEMLWRPYSELTEAEKDQDREWADKVLNLLT